MITKVIDSTKAAKNLLRNLFFYYSNLGSELVEYSTAHMLDPVMKGLLLKNLEKYKITQDLILAAHNLAAESEPLILSTSSLIRQISSPLLWLQETQRSWNGGD